MIQENEKSYAKYKVINKEQIIKPEKIEISELPPGQLRIERYWISFMLTFPYEQLLLSLTYNMWRLPSDKDFLWTT